MDKDELYEWLQEMNDHDLTKSEKDYIDTQFSKMEKRLCIIENQLDIIVKQYPIWS